MKASTIKLLLTLCIALFSISAGGKSVHAAELSKAGAAKLLTLMGDDHVVVAAVIKGLGAPFGGFPVSSDSVALVIAYSQRGGVPKKVEQTFYYDSDLGWFYYEVDTDRRSVRLWTTSGYREMRPQT
jgi:hypothetical protein